MVTDNCENKIYRDLENTKCSPEENTYQSILNHLRRHNACEDCFKAFKRAWKLYEKWAFGDA
jgi:hypothetical protein